MPNQNQSEKPLIPKSITKTFAFLRIRSSISVSVGVSVPCQLVKISVCI